MRKLLMGAVVASVSLAVATGAVAQDPDVQFSATVTPKNAGKKKKPKNTSVNFTMSVQKPGTTVEFIDLKLPKGLKLSGKGLGDCTAEDLEFEGPESCADDKAGPEGTATAALPNGSPLNFRVQPYVTDSNSLVLRVFGALAIDSPLPGEITAKGRRLRIADPRGAAPAGQFVRRDPDEPESDVHEEEGQEVPRLERRLQEPYAQGHRGADLQPAPRRRCRAAAADDDGKRSVHEVTR